MRIAVDLDGVLYEWDKTARYMLREYKGHSRSGPMGAESTSWDYTMNHVGKADWDWLWREGVELGLFRYGHVVTGGQTGVRRLREEGHTVEIVTHRPSSAVPDTIAWLGLFQKPEAGVVFDGIHVLTNGERKSSVAADILIDDKPSNLEDVIGHGKRGILFDRAWNQGAKPAGSLRAYGWPDVVKLVKEINANDAARNAFKELGVGEPDPRGAGNSRGLSIVAETAHAGRGPQASSR